MLNESAKVWANTLTEREREREGDICTVTNNQLQELASCTYIVHTSDTFKENKRNFNSDCLFFKILLKFGDGDCFCDHLEVEMCSVETVSCPWLVLHV